MSEETFRLIVAIGVILAATFSVAGGVAMIAIALGFKKLQKKVEAIIDRTVPILDTARRVADDTAPEAGAHHNGCCGT